jgi:hypothetical protein
VRVKSDDLQAHWDVLTTVVWPIVATALIVSVILGLLYWLIQKTPPLKVPREGPVKAAILFLCFALAGGLCGMSIGTSLQPVVGAVLPAILALLTSFFAFGFAREGGVQTRLLIAFCFIALLLMTTHLVFMGGKVRLDYELWAEKHQLEEAQKYKEAGLMVSPVDISKPGGLLQPPEAEQKH